MTVVFAFAQARRKAIIVLLMLVGVFLAGNTWSGRGWQEKWTDRDSVESSQEANARTTAHWIEQRHIIAHDEAVKDAQVQAAKSAAIAAGLSATVNQLRIKATKLTTHIDAAKHTPDLATSIRSKTAGVDAVMLADMLGDITAEAKRYAGIVDERCTTGVTCKRIYDSVRESNNNPTAPQ